MNHDQEESYTNHCNQHYHSGSNIDRRPVLEPAAGYHSDPFWIGRNAQRLEFLAPGRTWAAGIHIRGAHTMHLRHRDRPEAQEYLPEDVPPAPDALSGGFHRLRRRRLRLRPGAPNGRLAELGILHESADGHPLLRDRELPAQVSPELYRGDQASLDAG